jgi:protein-tyrosine phosphatase
VNEPNAYPQRCTYLRVAVPDVESTDLQRHFSKVNDFITTARTAGGRTLVHCSAGMSRSVSLALAYLISVEGMSLIDAYRLIKSKRSIVAPNPSFMRQLTEYEGTERQRTGNLTTGPSLDLEKYAANRFGKVDSYVLETYEESRFK